MLELEKEFAQAKVPVRSLWSSRSWSSSVRTRRKQSRKKKRLGSPNGGRGRVGGRSDAKSALSRRASTSRCGKHLRIKSKNQRLTASQSAITTALDWAKRGGHEHLELVRELIDVSVEQRTAPGRRGPAGQRRQRQLERNVRHETVDLYRWLKERGGTFAEASDLLDMSAHTLRQWDHDYSCGHLEVVPRGRPATRASVVERQAVLNFVRQADRRVGVPTLRTAFPTLGRNELADLVTRRRQAVHKALSRNCPRLALATTRSGLGHRLRRAVADWRELVVAGRRWSLSVCAGRAQLGQRLSTGLAAARGSDRGGDAGCTGALVRRAQHTLGAEDG